MRVVFRADASVTIGNGHVMRCLTLADALRTRGAECHFVMRDFPGHLSKTVQKRGFKLSLLTAPTGAAITAPPEHAAWAGVSWKDDIADTVAVIDSPDWLVLDHYSFDYRWQTAIQDKVGNILVIDDLADRQHMANVLLDQNLGRASTDYNGLVPNDCKRLIGPNFALLRPEFSYMRNQSIAARKSRQMSRLMIAMGGTDPINATSTVLKVLKTANFLPVDFQIDVIMGSSAPALAAVQKIAETMPWQTNVLVDVHNMAQLMKEADLAIGAGGGTTWERCCLGLPSIIIETASNQSIAVEAMVKTGAALGTGPISDKNFNDKFMIALKEASEQLLPLSECAAKLCDGLGAARVANNLFNPDLAIRKATNDDALNVWQWRNDGFSADFYLNPNQPQLPEHIAWFEAALCSASREMLIIEANGVPAAHVRFDHNLPKTTTANVSICVNPAVRGQGLGARILTLCCERIVNAGVDCIDAQIHEKNIASRKIFERAGFVKIDKNDQFSCYRLTTR